MPQGFLDEPDPAFLHGDNIEGMMGVEGLIADLANSEEGGWDGEAESGPVGEGESGGGTEEEEREEEEEEWGRSEEERGEEAEEWSGEEKDEGEGKAEGECSSEEVSGGVEGGEGEEEEGLDTAETTGESEGVSQVQSGDVCEELRSMASFSLRHAVVARFFLLLVALLPFFRPLHGRTPVGTPLMSSVLIFANVRRTGGIACADAPTILSDKAEASDQQHITKPSSRWLLRRSLVVRRRDRCATGDRAEPQSLHAETLGSAARSDGMRFVATSGKRLSRSLLSKRARRFARPHTGNRASTWTAATRVEAVFGFGDSYMDGGNNKFIKGSGYSMAFPPYGRDYIPNRGSASNGMMLLDVIGGHHANVTRYLLYPALHRPYPDYAWCVYWDAASVVHVR